MTTGNVTCDNITSSTGYFVTQSNDFIVGQYGEALGFSSNKVSYLLIEGAGSSSNPMYIGPTASSYLIYGVVAVSGTFYMNLSYSGNQTITCTATFGIYVDSTRIGSKTVTLSSGGGYLPSSNNYGLAMSGSFSQSLGNFTTSITSGTKISLKYEYNTGFTSSISQTITTTNTTTPSVSTTWTGDSYVGLSSAGKSGTVFISPNAAASSIYGGTTYINVATGNTSGGYATRRHISMGAGGRELVYIQQPSTGWTTTSDKRVYNIYMYRC